MRARATPSRGRLGLERASARAILATADECEWIPFYNTRSRTRRDGYGALDALRLLAHGGEPRLQIRRRRLAARLSTHLHDRRLFYRLR